jgi:hypothetical protein
MNEMPFAIFFRKKITVITDPQRRVYWGVPFSSEEVWSGWQRLYGLPTEEEAEESAEGWRKINPNIQYEVRKIAQGVAV